MKKKYKKIALLLGGPSAEREVSLVSGAAVYDALNALGYESKKFDPAQTDAASLAQFKKQLQEFAPDACFNALHGQFGEDGAVQEILESLKIPYTHSGPAASRLAMNKLASLNLFQQHGLSIAKHESYDATKVNGLTSKDITIGFPLVIKPIYEGSSVGLYIVKTESAMPDLSSWHFGDALIEEYIDGLELTTAVLEIDGVARALAVTELQPKRGVYDYKAKYQDGETTHVCPAAIAPDIYQQCLAMGLAAHRAIGAAGVSRSDFRYNPVKKQLVILETNTQPGMTALSLVPEQAKYKDIPFTQLVEYILSSASLKL